MFLLQLQHRVARISLSLSFVARWAHLSFFSRGCWQNRAGSDNVSRDFVTHFSARGEWHVESSHENRGVWGKKTKNVLHAAATSALIGQFEKALSKAKTSREAAHLQLFLAGGSVVKKSPNITSLVFGLFFFYCCYDWLEAKDAFWGGNESLSVHHNWKDWLCHMVWFKKRKQNDMFCAAWCTCVAFHRTTWLELVSIRLTWLLTQKSESTNVKWRSQVSRVDVNSYSSARKTEQDISRKMENAHAVSAQLSLTLISGIQQIRDVCKVENTRPNTRQGARCETELWGESFSFINKFFAD